MSEHFAAFIGVSCSRRFSTIAHRKLLIIENGIPLLRHHTCAALLGQSRAIILHAHIPWPEGGRMHISTLTYQANFAYLCALDPSPDICAYGKCLCGHEAPNLGGTVMHSRAGHVLACPKRAGIRTTWLTT